MLIQDQLQALLSNKVPEARFKSVGQITGTDAVPKAFLFPHLGCIGGISAFLGTSQNPKTSSSSLQTPLSLSTQQPIPKILQSLTLHSSSSSGGWTVAVATLGPPLGPQERFSRLVVEYCAVLFGWRQQTSSEAEQEALRAWLRTGGQHSPSEYK